MFNFATKEPADNLTGSFKDVIHRLMHEVMLEIMPAALSIKIMPAFLLELHCVLAGMIFIPARFGIHQIIMLA
jgi:hypothetical protein